MAKRIVFENPVQGPTIRYDQSSGEIGCDCGWSAVLSEINRLDGTWIGFRNRHLTKEHNAKNLAGCS